MGECRVPGPLWPRLPDLDYLSGLGPVPGVMTRPPRESLPAPRDPVGRRSAGSEWELPRELDRRESSDTVGLVKHRGSSPLTQGRGPRREPK